MAEIIGIVGSVIAVANTTGALSRALFDIVETIKNAHKEIAEIAHELQVMSVTLHVLWDILRLQPDLFRPALADNTEAILQQYIQVERSLTSLIDSPRNIARLTWLLVKPKVKSLLKKVEAIKASLTLQLMVVQLAREETLRLPSKKDASDAAVPIPNRFRILVESAVQANRQVIESAQCDSAGKDTLTADAKLDKKGKNTLQDDLIVYKERSYDTATWLYHLVFGSQAAYQPTQYHTGDTEPDHPSVADKNPENSNWLAYLPNTDDRSLSYPPSPPSPPPDAGISRDASRSMIVWNKQTEPSHVVDRLLADWTTLTQEQIDLSSKRPKGHDSHEKFLRSVQEAKEEQEAADFEKDENPDEPGYMRSGVSRISSPRPPAQVPAFPPQWDGSVMSDFTDDNNIPVFRSPLDFESTRSESQHDFGRLSDPQGSDDSNPWNSSHKDAKDSSELSSDLETFKDDTEERSRMPSVSTDDDRSGSPRDSPKIASRVKQVSFKLGSTTQNWNEAKKHKNKKSGRNRTRSPEGRTRTQRTKLARAQDPFGDTHQTVASPSLDERANTGSNVYSPTNVIPGPLPRQPDYSDSSQYTSRHGTNYSNPFTPITPPYQAYPPPSRNPYAPMNFSANPSPYDPPWPPHFPNGAVAPANPPHATMPMHAQKQEPVVSSRPVAREEDMLAVITAILESTDKRTKAETEDPRLSRILQLLVMQQEQNTEAELNRAKETAEIEMKQILAARDRDDARIRQLEDLIKKQRDEQQASDAKWRAERAALDEKFAEQASQAKELAEREIAAARSARKAARKSLKFAKAEAEKRTKEEADAKAKEGRKKANKQSKERIQHYEKLLDVAVEGRSVTQQIEQPLRRTCIVDGNRSMEVSEYSADGSNPHANTSMLTSGFLRQAIYGSGADWRVDNGRPRIGQRQHSRSSGSIASFQTSGIPREEPFGVLSAQRDQSQQLILLPARLGSSAKNTELQLSLEKFGLSARSEDLEFDRYDTSSLLDNLDGAVVRSSVFWEAPSLSLGSELLNTLRTYGWRPPYARSSASGHTHFLGSQPIHAYFFKPNYKPQFTSGEPSVDTERIIIDKALIHEYALRELGHEFEEIEAGSYSLDGRLQYSDIEALIERSFQMRENYFRSQFRQLNWRRNTSKEPRQTQFDQTPEIPRVPRSPISVVGSHTSFAATASQSGSENGDDDTEFPDENEHEETESQQQSEGETTESDSGKSDDGTEFQGQKERDDESVTTEYGMGSSQLSTTTSNISTSLTSWSSNSNNPFRRRAKTPEENGKSSRSLTNFPSSPWDEPLILLD